MKTPQLQGKNTGKTKVINDALQEAFAPVMARFNLLFNDDTKYEIQLPSEEELYKMLVEGEGTYWDLVWNEKETDIIRVIPYPTQRVIEMLDRQARLSGFDDIFYDFNKRQKENME